MVKELNMYKSPKLSRIQWSMEIDLQSDLNDYFYRIMTEKGWKDVQRDKAVYQFFNMEKRLITRRPRQIKKSREFSCPMEYEKTLHKLEERIRKGEDLTPYMSREVKQSQKTDLLLCDWGVYHFHLSEDHDYDGFMVRSDYQVFAYVTETTVYMIQIYKHKSKDLYSKQELLRIIYNNWPDIIEQYRIPGAVELTAKLNDHEYGMLRKAHISSFVELEKNKVYGMMGGGYVGNGFSMDAMRKGQFWYNRMYELQRCLSTNAEKIVKMIQEELKNNNLKCVDMDISLLGIVNENFIAVYDNYSKLVIQLNTSESYIRVCRPEQILFNVTYDD